jgi:DHA2 family multidrug resistance protein-like MFS transporter
MGINALVAAVSSAVGPTVAAGILSVASWKWLFAVNVPLGVIAWLIAMRSLPNTPESRHSFDLPSALLNAATLGMFISAIDGFAHGQTAIEVGLEIVVSVVAGFVLVQRQLTRPAPLLPVDLLRIRLFSLSLATSVCSFTSQMMAFTALPFYLQDVLGRGETATGVLMTPWPAMTAVIAPIAGRLADRISAGVLGGVGLAIFAIGLSLLALLPAHASALDIIWRMGVCGFGFGLFQSPNNRAIISAAPARRSGGASGMLGTARLLGQTTGAALVAVVFSILPLHATGTALFTASGIAAAAAAVSCLRLVE